MEQLELRAVSREILGKKVRFLRRQSITPVHLFGHGLESMALQCDTAELKHILSQAGHVRLISLWLDKAKKPRNAIVREIQREPRTGELLHVDFYQVRMEEKIKVELPITLVGEAPALKSKENMLAHELERLTIECLPGEIPSSVKLDLSSLTEAGQAIHVKDIVLGEGIAILDDPEQIVVKISVMRAEKVEEVVKAPPEVAGAAEAAPAPAKEAKEE